MPFEIYVHCCSLIIGASQVDLQIQKIGGKRGPVYAPLGFLLACFLYLTFLGCTQRFVKGALLTKVWRLGKNVGAPEVGASTSRRSVCAVWVENRI